MMDILACSEFNISFFQVFFAVVPNLTARLILVPIRVSVGDVLSWLANLLLYEKDHNR